MEKKVQHDSMLLLEHGLLKVPYEQLHKAFRSSRKHVEKELHYWSSIMNPSSKSSQSVSSTSAESSNKQDIQLQDPAQIQNLINRLETLKRKLEDADDTETKILKRSNTRLNSLEKDLLEVESTDDERYVKWCEKRLWRLLADYLVRNGYFDTAEQLTSNFNIEEFADIELFSTSRMIEQSLNARSCTECLNWCNENKAHIKKSKSPLEFQLRIQEFIELVRKGKLEDAIEYSKRHFVGANSTGTGSWISTQRNQIQRVMALLAFPPSTNCPIYQKYYDESRWDELIAQFRRDNFSLHQLTRQTILSIVLQAGLSALKTPYCYDEGVKSATAAAISKVQESKSDFNMARLKSNDCPVCQHPYTTLASSLPFSHHTTSCLVCQLTGEVMDENNPPMVLPSGRVYSFEGLMKMSGLSNDQTNKSGALNFEKTKNLTSGKVYDISTGEQYDVADCKKAYLA